MKQQFFTRRAGIIGAICLLIISLSSCLKDNNDYVAPPAALISAINASPDAQPLDFYLDNNKGNFYPIQSGESMDYIRAYTGKRNISFMFNGSMQKVKTDTATLKANQLYSIFIANKVNTPDYLLVRDSISQPAAGMATIRFVNLSPNVTGADLAIQGGAVLATNKAYRTYSAFVPVQGDKTYTFEIRQAGTSTVLATLSNVQVYGNTINTIWLQGFNGATDQTKLSAHFQNNVYYY